MLSSSYPSAGIIVVLRNSSPTTATLAGITIGNISLYAPVATKTVAGVLSAKLPCKNCKAYLIVLNGVAGFFPYLGSSLPCKLTYQTLLISNKFSYFKVVSSSTFNNSPAFPIANLAVPAVLPSSLVA